MQKRKRIAGKTGRGSTDRDVAGHSHRRVKHTDAKATKKIKVFLKEGHVQTEVSR